MWIPPRSYDQLSERSELQPRDLATLSHLIIFHFNTPEYACWHRSLAVALFDWFKLSHLPQRQAIAEETHRDRLIRALNMDDKPSWSDPVGRAWAMRRRILELPYQAVGMLEGDPFMLAFPQYLPEPVRPLAESLSRDLSTHAHAATALTLKIDRAIVALWGCPVERLDAQVKVSELVAAGLTLQQFNPWAD